MSLFQEFSHPSTGPGPDHLARLTKELGIAALEESWKRCTGKILSENVRNALKTEDWWNIKSVQGVHYD